MVGQAVGHRLADEAGPVPRRDPRDRIRRRRRPGACWRRDRPEGTGREDASLFRHVSAVRHCHLAHVGPGLLNLPFLEHRSLKSDDVHRSGVDDGRSGETVQGERVVGLLVAGVQSRPRFQEIHPALDDLGPGEAGVEARRERRRNRARRLEPVVFAGVAQLVEDVDEVGGARLRAPLEHGLLGELGHEAAPEEALRRGVAKPTDPAELLECRPQLRLVVVDEGVAHRAGAGREAVRLSVVVAVRNRPVEWRHARVDAARLAGRDQSDHDEERDEPPLHPNLPR